jgi:uncharacterized protein
MRINVSGLLKSAIGTVRDYQVSDAVNISGRNSLVEGKVSLVRTDRGILVKAVLATEVELSCGRCLTQFCLPLTIRIEEEYFPVVDVTSGGALTAPNEPGCFTLDEHHDLDLTEAIRQYALIAVPMKPLCREDCAGLCPSCGHNLNRGACGCVTQEIDPRWTKLLERQLSEDQ